MPSAVDTVSAMVDGAARSVESVAHVPIQVSNVASIPVESAFGSTGIMVNRSALASGVESGSLLTVVPAGGVATGEGIVDAVALAAALAAGAAQGIANAGGPLFQVAPPALVPSVTGLDLGGAQAISFELVAAAKKATVVLIVEATLGSLLGGSTPVEEFPVGGPSVASAQLPSLGRVGVVPANRKIETLSDVVTRVSVEIARGTVRVHDLVSMAQGTVFELDREAGDAVDVRVNGAMVARGDIVVVGKNVGVRITKITGEE
jgi:flagellar motor switch protein FliN/FliY